MGWYSEAIFEALEQSRAGGKRQGLVVAVSASGFPVGFDFAGVERFFDTKARNHTNSLRAKVTKHHASPLSGRAFAEH